MSESKNETERTLYLDPAHEAIDIFAQEITRDIWKDKYRYGREKHPLESNLRVVDGVYANDSEEHAHLALTAMNLGLWIPAGRIQAGAGTPHSVTWINCFVSCTIDDSMNGIADALKDAMLTMQQGGGIGMNFGTLRPSGAFLQRTASIASGPLPFMDMWDAMCKTIMSAGSRRGAMMGVMPIDHPDIKKFILAKTDGQRLRNFNLSVLVSDAFIKCVEDDEMWDLGFNVPPADDKFLDAYETEVDEHWFVYEQIKARELWDLIIKTTYEYSEPGVIFIDRMNDQNNLYYCESIEATNPCGEQPLPPYGACNLGAINLARLIKHPFEPGAHLDDLTLSNVVSIGVRFLDNVIDRTGYPLEEQAEQQRLKRRIGLGYTGLANALAMLGLRYGSPEAIEATDAIGKTIAWNAYFSSCILAEERGAFPLFEETHFSKSHFMQLGILSTFEFYKKAGIRNGTLLTIAPTGTTSIYYGNVSSGLEPVFAHEVQRKVLQPDDSFKEYTAKDYGLLVYEHVTGHKGPAEHMIEADDLSVHEHLRMQAAAQKWIDTSVSKTINCPKDISLEDFKKVYDMAYALGLKGCTTYRHSDARGSVLSHVPGDSVRSYNQLLPRPPVLQGSTYKVNWPNINSALYVTINDDPLSHKPLEMFINSRSTKHAEWITALTLMISAIMRRGEDISFIPEELKKITSNDDIAWIDGRYYGSLVARIGEILQQHIEGGEPVTGTELPGETCPMCEKPTYIFKEGCGVCTSCSYSKCD